MTQFNMCDDAVNVFQDAYLLDYFMNQFAAWDDCLVMKEFNFRESHRHMDKGTHLFFSSMPTIRAVIFLPRGFLATFAGMTSLAK